MANRVSVEIWQQICEELSTLAPDDIARKSSVARLSRASGIIRAAALPVLYETIEHENARKATFRRSLIGDPSLGDYVKSFCWPFHVKLCHINPLRIPSQLFYQAGSEREIEGIWEKWHWDNAKADSHKNLLEYLCCLASMNNLRKLQLVSSGDRDQGLSGSFLSVSDYSRAISSPSLAQIKSLRCLSKLETISLDLEEGTLHSPTLAALVEACSSLQGLKLSPDVVAQISSASSPLFALSPLTTVHICGGEDIDYSESFLQNQKVLAELLSLQSQTLRTLTISQPVDLEDLLECLTPASSFPVLASFELTKLLINVKMRPEKNWEKLFQVMPSCETLSLAFSHAVDDFDEVFDVNAALLSVLCKSLPLRASLRKLKLDQDGYSAQEVSNFSIYEPLLSEQLFPALRQVHLIFTPFEAVDDRFLSSFGYVRDWPITAVKWWDHLYFKFAFFTRPLHHRDFDFVVSLEGDPYSDAYAADELKYSKNQVCMVTREKGATRLV